MEPCVAHMHVICKGDNEANSYMESSCKKTLGKRIQHLQRRDKHNPWIGQSSSYFPCCVFAPPSLPLVSHGSRLYKLGRYASLLTQKLWNCYLLSVHNMQTMGPCLGVEDYVETYLTSCYLLNDLANKTFSHNWMGHFSIDSCAGLWTRILDCLTSFSTQLRCIQSNHLNNFIFYMIWQNILSVVNWAYIVSSTGNTEYCMILT